MKRIKSILLWVVAFVLMFAIATYQRQTGPTYPIQGTATIGAHTFEYSLTRSHGGETDHPVIIELDDPEITGTVIWKRYRLEESWYRIPMQRMQVEAIEQGHDGSYHITPSTNSEGQWILVAYLPNQPPAGKLEYEVLLTYGAEELQLPESGESCVIRYKGEVPFGVLVPHIFIMFFAMMFSLRASFSALFGEKLQTISWLTIIFLFVGGLILGPIVQKYAFGAYWTGWPFGEDLTDNKTLVAFVFWAAALWILRSRFAEKWGRWSVLGASVILLVVYLIPHSMRGSEIDWSQVPQDSLVVPGQGDNQQESSLPEIE